jgi:hypothetical protein
MDNQAPHPFSGAGEFNKPLTWKCVQSFMSVAIVMGVIALLIIAMLPSAGSDRPGRRAKCISHLKMIAFALQNYAAAHNAFPPAYTTDADGKPLHSWRTLILPQLEEQKLYQSIDLSKPWDDPVNVAAFKSAVDVYRCPSSDDDRQNYTTYLAVVTPESCVRPGEPRPLSEAKGTQSLTLLLIEVDADHAIPWMQPIDADENLILQLGPKSRLNHAGGFPAQAAKRPRRT